MLLVPNPARPKTSISAPVYGADSFCSFAVLSLCTQFLALAIKWLKLKNWFTNNISVNF